MSSVPVTSMVDEKAHQAGVAAFEKMWRIVDFNSEDAALRAYAEAYEAAKQPLEDKRLTRALKDAECCFKHAEELLEKLRQRDAIIADKVLGWQKYKVNDQQEAYAPCQDAALNIGVGQSLFKLVDDAIKEMSA